MKTYEMVITFMAGACFGAFVMLAITAIRLLT